MKRLLPEHYDAIALILAPKDERMTNTQIAEHLGIHRNTLMNWQNDPLFQRELKKTVTQRTHGRLDELVNAMMDTAINEGSAAMAKLLLQMNEMLTDKVEVNNVTETDSTSVDALQAKIKERMEQREEKDVH